jgi:hypothetical protein
MRLIMSTRNISLFILGLLVALQASWANAASIVDLPFLDRQFSIDGKVTPDEINGAAVIDLTAMGELAKPRYLTKVYSIVTPNALYLGFVCDDPTPKDLVAKEKKTNGPVFADDSIEFFFTPNMEGNKYNYFHFAVNAAGVTYSASMEDDTPALNWECAVKPTDKGWGGEMLIPLSTVRASPHMSYWRANIARNRVARDTEPAEKSVWVDPGTTMHNFRKFGYLKLPRSLQPGYATSVEAPAGFGSATTGTAVQVKADDRPATGFGDSTTVTVPQARVVPGFDAKPTTGTAP